MARLDLITSIKDSCELKYDYFFFRLHSICEEFIEIENLVTQSFHGNQNKRPTDLCKFMQSPVSTASGKI